MTGAQAELTDVGRIAASDELSPVDERQSWPRKSSVEGASKRGRRAPVLHEIVSRPRAGEEGGRTYVSTIDMRSNRIPDPQRTVVIVLLSISSPTSLAPSFPRDAPLLHSRTGSSSSALPLSIARTNDAKQRTFVQSYVPVICT